jgi:hypothetical protein
VTGPATCAEQRFHAASEYERQMTDFKQIQALLGDKASSLLEHKSKTVTKDKMNLP